MSKITIRDVEFIFYPGMSMVAHKLSKRSIKYFPLEKYVTLNIFGLMEYEKIVYLFNFCTYLVTRENVLKTFI